MPTYTPNGVQQSTNITFDDAQRWLVGQMADGRFIVVKDNQKASPIEAISGDATTGALTVVDLATNASFRVPVFTTLTMPPATTVGRMIYTSDDGNLRVANGASWVTLAQSGAAGVTASGSMNLNQLIVGSGGTVVQALGSLGTTTTVYHGNAAGMGTFGAVALTTDVSGTLPTANGGLGVASPTAHGILVGEGASAVTPLTLTNGQLLIGSTGADPVAATLTPGAGVNINNTAGAITISAGALAHSGSDVTLTNTVTETSMISTTLAGGTLGTDNRLRLETFWRVTGDPGTGAGAGFGVSFRLKYGGTTLLNPGSFPAVADNGAGTIVALTNNIWHITFNLAAHGATNAQLAWYNIDPLSASVTTAGGGLLSNFWTISFVTLISRGTATVDSTVSQPLALTAQWGHTGALNSITLEHWDLVTF